MIESWQEDHNKALELWNSLLRKGLKDVIIEAVNEIKNHIKNFDLGNLDHIYFNQEDGFIQFLYYFDERERFGLTVKTKDYNTLVINRFATTEYTPEVDQYFEQLDYLKNITLRLE